MQVCVQKFLRSEKSWCCIHRGALWEFSCWMCIVCVRRRLCNQFVKWYSNAHTLAHKQFFTVGIGLPYLVLRSQFSKLHTRSRVAQPLSWNSRRFRPTKRIPFEMKGPKYDSTQFFFLQPNKWSNNAENNAAIIFNGFVVNGSTVQNISGFRNRIPPSINDANEY